MIIYGKQVSLYVLNYHEHLIKNIYINSKMKLPQDLFNKQRNKIKFIEEQWAQKMSKNQNHQGIILDIEDFKEDSFDNIKNNDFILILDGITDSGNIGAIVRSAYILGVDSILVTGVNQLNFSSIAKTSSGAIFNTSLIVVNDILDKIHQLKQIGFIVYGASKNSSNFIELVKFPKKRMLILGSEDKGISKKILSKVDNFISIKMKKEFDSLNVSAAASILIHRMEYGI